jgi:hypothetical protein
MTKFDINFCYCGFYLSIFLCSSNSIALGVVIDEFCWVFFFFFFFYIPISVFVKTMFFNPLQKKMGTKKTPKQNQHLALQIVKQLARK